MNLLWFIKCSAISACTNTFTYCFQSWNKSTQTTNVENDEGDDGFKGEKRAPVGGEASDCMFAVIAV